MSQKIKSIPGMNDILPAEVSLWQKLENKTRQIFENYGFAEIRTPLLEETQLFSRGIGENTQVVQKEMYTFQDKGNDWVTLRPEGTASVVRAYVQHSMQAQEAITKLYYMGPMFRYERPQKGRLRQFHQIGAEIIGIDSPLADAEVVIMLDRLVKSLGISDYRLQVNSLGTTEERAGYIAKLTEFFSTKKDALCPECQVRLEKNPMRLLDCKVEGCRKIAKESPLLPDSLGEVSTAEFAHFKKSLDEAGVVYEVNPRIVRGLDYYEKTTFEFVSDKLGSQSAFAGGGRYNKLVAELGGQDTPAVGFAMGCERVIMLLKELSNPETAPSKKQGVHFAAMTEAAFLQCRKLLQMLRDAGVAAEMDYTQKSLKSQMRRADKLGFAYVAIVGEDELKAGAVALKNLVTSAQENVGFGEIVGRVK